MTQIRSRAHFSIFFAFWLKNSVYIMERSWRKENEEEEEEEEEENNKRKPTQLADEEGRKHTWVTFAVQEKEKIETKRWKEVDVGLSKVSEAQSSLEDKEKEREKRLNELSLFLIRSLFCFHNSLQAPENEISRERESWKRK